MVLSKRFVIYLPTCQLHTGRGISAQFVGYFTPDLGFDIWHLYRPPIGLFLDHVLLFWGRLLPMIAIFWWEGLKGVASSLRNTEPRFAGA